MNAHNTTVQMRSGGRQHDQVARECVDVGDRPARVGILSPTLTARVNLVKLFHHADASLLFIWKIKVNLYLIGL